ncbi:MAG: hypothetical protein HZA46_19395 [Planctomycetales bacterium]|nr:hypothetical protein [Planctomycetales bacterium]
MRLVCSLVVMLIVAGGGSTANGEPADNLRSRQEAQQRARTMARELVSSVLEVQLQQLEENGLKELPLYRDIEGMRENLSKLVDAEMAQVVDLLAKAQQGDKATRDQSFKDARRLIRDVIVRLSYERQMLLRRLKTAELAAQTKRVIELQTKTHDVTKGLPDQPQARRETAALQTIEDQRDVKELVVQLIDSLGDVSRWDGPVGAAAGEGLKLLNTASVGKELDQAEKRLESTSYADATTSQQAVIRGLQQLLAKLEATRGLLDADRDSSLAAVREVFEKQEQLRDQTKQAAAAKTDPEKLVAQQNDVAQDLRKLAEALADNPDVRELVEQARVAATEARTDLFESTLPEAMADQDKVLASLAEVAERLATDPSPTENDRTAEEMKALVRDLETAKDEMAAIQKQQAEASRSAKKPEAEPTRKQEQTVAEALTNLAEKKDLPQSVEEKLAAAAEAVRSAEKAAQEAAKQPQDAAATEAMQREVAKADDAVEMAAAEVNTALADAKRQAEAVKIGELARAAEVLERAAAAERQVARAAKAAAEDDGMKPESAKALASKQQTINEVATNVAKGIEKTAPKAAEQVQQAMESGKAAQQDLEVAAEIPGEPSKAASSNAAEKAEQTASKLQQAAAAIRKEIGSTAKELAKESAKQREQVAAVRDDVMQALPDEAVAAQTDKMKRLAQAAAKIREAQTAQADAMQSSKPGSKPTSSAGVPPSGGKEPAKAGTPTAPQAEPKVAAKSDKPANGDDSKPASSPAKSDPGKPESAATKNAPAQPDATDQRKVTEATQAAKKLADKDVPDADAALARAEQSSSDAEKQAAKGEGEKTKASQEATQAALAQAAKAIGAEMDKLVESASEQQAKQAAKANELAGKAATVDAPATAALQSAAKSKPAADKNAKPTGEEMAETRGDAQRALERAAASLAAREQRVLRDQAIAEAIARMAEEQQHAVEELTAASKADLPASPKYGKPGKNSPAPAMPAAAQAQFAQTQRATGQGAAEVSEQSEIANPPLREALQQAANLLGEATPMAAGEAGQPAGDAVAGQPMPSEGSPAGQGKPAPGSAGSKPSSPAAANAAASPSQAAAGSPSGDGEATSPAFDASLGTGFVPNSPELTAQMIAGADAAAAAAAAMAAAGQPGQPGAQGKGTAQGKPGQPSQANAAGEGENPNQGETSATATGAGSTKGGQFAQNKAVKNGPPEAAAESQRNRDSRTADGGNRDADAIGQPFAEEPWFTKLPPDLRKAIRARSQRPPPRGYEQRLQRYFESLD